MDDFWSQPVDHQALTLAHAIALQESAGGDGKPNYQAIGDAGTSKGAYQWQPGNFEAGAKEAGLDPNDFSPANQDKVAYYQVKKYKDEGYDPGQIASLWNSGSPDNWQNHSGTTTINGQQIAYDTPRYVQGVQAHYQNLIGAQPAAASIPGFAPPQQPQAQTPAPAGIDTALQSPEGAGGSLLGGAKAVGNFLFPIVGDLYNDVTGNNNKTVMQQIGDAGLSALPFIPGLGEFGEGARGAGLAAKVLGTAAGRGALTGYGAGVASNLSQGESLGQSFMPNLNTIAGTITGGVAPGLIKGIGGLAEKAAGISPQIKNELTALGEKSEPGDAELYDKYINATKQHAADVRAKGSFNIAADELDRAASIVTSLKKAAGKAVGSAKNAAADTDFAHDQQITDNFVQAVQDRFGIKLTPIIEQAKTHDGLPVIDFSGEAKPVSYQVSPVEGSMREIDPSVAQRVSKIATQLSKLPDSSVKQANEIISNLYDLVDYTKSDQYGHVNDPLESVIKSTAHDVNEAIRKSSPTVAKANDTFHELRSLQDEIKTMAGKNLQKGEMLMRRVFAGDKSGEVNDFFQKIKDATGIDLVKHAVLAKHAIESVGSTEDKTKLEQILESALEAKSGLVSGLVGLGKKAARSTFANPERIGRNMVKGRTNGQGVQSGVTKGLIEAGRGLSPLVNLISQ